MIKGIVFLGPPGSGKGTQAQLLAKSKGFLHLSTGDIFRNEIKNKTALGIEVQQIVDSGLYVPDQLTNTIIKKRINQAIDSSCSYLLDGYPRTIEQAQFIDQQNFQLDKVVLFCIDDAVLIERLSQRRMCQKCKTIYNLQFNPPKDVKICDNDGAELIWRKDDHPQQIARRLAIYKEQTKPLVNYYKQKNLVVEIDASVEFKKVHQQIVKKVFND